MKDIIVILLTATIAYFGLSVVWKPKTETKNTIINDPKKKLCEIYQSVFECDNKTTLKISSTGQGKNLYIVDNNKHIKCEEESSPNATDACATLNQLSCIKDICGEYN